ncbi:hypothetical protein LAV72_01835 [Lysinibacillus xylanilyticus]|uniref:hypothetical protein n=1 Tax=Lysinibacillus xylanilyticus TaxID=582475 RepID=UPI002B24F300|nr:hypothetical protein [Lysinibacillus xylanilyticus]MEB2298368.1 hypothetical protein [Lysinibacillus xylanilyticus]
MQKKLFTLPALFLTAILVVGCNTTDKTEDSDVQKNEPSNTEQQQKPTTEDKTVDGSEETPTSTETDKGSTETTDSATAPKQEVNYIQKGKDKTETATESKSADQGYKMQQLPGFKLSQEEPGKDMLVSNENAEVFMRIEDVSQSSYDEAKTSMQDYMNAVGETSSLSSEDLAAFKGVKNIEGYVVNFEEDKEKVIGVVFEKDGLIIKLTIHDNDELDLTDAMFKMAATISKK